MNEPTFWRKCSTCKKPMGFRQPYQRCNVTTCNRPRVSLVFCTVSCWSAHVPVYNHRDAWALEEISPSAEEWARQQAEAGEAPASVPRSAPAPAAPPPRVESAPPAPVVVRRESSGESVRRDPAPAPTAGLSPANESEVLVVVSKLKAYIRERSDMNTSADVMDILSKKLRALCDQAIQRARADNRKTVMARDF